MDCIPPQMPQSEDSKRVLTLNGQPYPWSGGTISDLLKSVPFPAKGAAVEVNGLVVPRACHEQQILHFGDQVEIVCLVGGG